jgi:hypothetical protein
VQGFKCNKTQINMDKLTLYSSEFEQALLSLDKLKAETIIRQATNEQTPIDVAGYHGNSIQLLIIFITKKTVSVSKDGSGLT